MPYQNADPTAEERKKDHIELAFQSQITQSQLDNRFYYEPILAAHPRPASLAPITFLEKKLKAPIWVSSMTGGTALALTINHNLARACRDFGMGMGLGSCRALLFSNERIQDFDVRHIIGDDLPLFANLGIAQLEQLLEANELWRIDALLDKLRADGLIIHVNPLQEWLQPEGDQIKYPPIETIQRLLEVTSTKLIVKEVGQGMGYESLKALLQLPLDAIDFAASGGTNFAKLELLRSDNTQQAIYEQIALIGHSAAEMVDMTNHILQMLGDKVLCRQIIISGGIQNFMDGYYLMQKLQLNSIYGQASAFLKHARGDYDTLFQYISAQIKGLELANAFLNVR